MAQHGFIDLNDNYWVAISDVNDETRALFPEGTIEVPIRPTHLHTFDRDNGVWIDPPDEELNKLVGNEIRAERDYRLHGEVDKIVSNPLRWESLSESKQDEIKAYRQALLDLPQQVGFPTSFTWPTKFEDP